MADSAYLATPAIRDSGVVLDSPRHTAMVRVTHWVNTLSFFGLLVSGIAIILAHPRFYWGETGGVGGPSLFDLPLPFVLVGQTGWGRYLHFQSAWIFVLTGLPYVISGTITRHFRKDFSSYNVIQRLTYLGVIFVLAPLMIWTGLAMSPAITSVFPGIVTVFGGQQSARTIHFFAADLLVAFLFVHIAMVWRAGFKNRVRAMITGHNYE
ncbi:MAG: cytochrome b/b6 domain-containing protein [Bryobacteraceae bacterium]|jgi:thiosulfate reductase cytochrome b subunit